MSEVPMWNEFHPQAAVALEAGWRPPEGESVPKGARRFYSVEQDQFVVLVPPVGRYRMTFWCPPMEAA